MAHSGTSNTRMELRNSSNKIIPLYNADHLAKQLRSINRDTAPFEGKVNTLRYTCRGRTSITGWFLTDCKSINDLLPKIYNGSGKEDVSLTLVDKGESLQTGYDPAAGDTRANDLDEVSIKKLYVTAAYAVTGVVREDITKPDEAGSRTSTLQPGYDPGGEVEVDNHDNQMYVLHVTDYRFYTTLSAYTGAFNLREKLWDEASTTNVYEQHEGFTWESMLDALWGSGGASALDHGSASYPTIDPANYHFWGVNSNDAIMKVLDDIDHTIVRNLDGTSTVATMSTLDTTSSSERETYKTELTEVSNDMVAPFLPEKVRVIFPKWDYQFQTGNTDELTPQDFWNNRPIWYVDKTTATLIGSSSNLDKWKEVHGSTADTMPNTIEVLHDGLIAQFNPRASGDSGITSGGTTPSNNSDIDDKATERATEYIESKLNSDNSIFREIYRGYIPFTPTKDISSITWSNGGGGAQTVIESVGRAFDSKFLVTSLGVSRGSGGGETSSGYDLRETSSRRVAQEFPGAPDHARLSEPVLRWAIALTKAEAAPGVRVNCDVFYGLESSGSITFTDTGDRDILVTNISKTATMPTASRILAYWNEQIREWVTCWFEASEGNLLGGEWCAITTARGAVTAYTQDDCFDHVELLRANKDSLLRSFKRTVSNTSSDAINACRPSEFDEDTEWKDADALEMLISIDPSPASTDYGGGYVIGSGASNTVGKVRWTEAPEIGKHLVIGSTVNSVLTTPAFVAFKGNGRANSVALSAPGNFTLMMKVNPAAYLIANGDIATEGALTPVALPSTCSESQPADATVLFPNNDASFRPGMHMSVKETGAADAGTGNNCLQMRWTSPGVWGYIDVQGASNVDHADSSTQVSGISAGGFNYRLWFDDGICTKVEKVPANGESAGGNNKYLYHRTDTAGADCSHAAYSPPNPCD